MTISVECPNVACKKRLTAKEELAGKVVKCPACGQRMRLPARDTPPLAASDSRSAIHTSSIAHIENPRKTHIGDYEWCEPDYRQILMWAEALHLQPETVIERLLTEPETKWNHQVYTRFENGRIVALHWNLELLRLKTFKWVDGLAIEAIAFFAPEWYAKIHGSLSLSLPLPELRCLHCRNVVLAKLDLSAVPQLETLLSWDNHLTVVDLTSVPQLTWLWLQKNELAELDLSQVPLLTKLSCWGNRLTELDLSAVPKLAECDCAMNKIATLDSSAVPKLASLKCHLNRLGEIDISNVPQLTELECEGNELAKLDLSAVPKLTRLRCGGNQLTELDLSLVPLLTELMCYENQLTELDLSAVPELTLLFCYNNQLTELDFSGTPKLREVSLWFAASPNTRYCNNIAELDIRTLDALVRLEYDASETSLIQRSDQNF